MSQRWENVEVLGYGFFGAVGLRDAFCGLLAFSFNMDSYLLYPCIA